MSTPDCAADVPSIPPPAVPGRIIQRRPRRPAARVKLNSMNDLEVWDKTDEEICNAALASYKSDVYGHYKMRVRRHTKPDPLGDGTVPDYLEYEFHCKTDPNRHPPQYRRRSETHRGTGNLKASLEACQARNNENNTSKASASTPFSYAMHLAIIVMMCAYHYLPFAGVLHDLVRRHVQLLRPGTSMPDSTTVSRTTRHVYEKQGEKLHWLQDNGFSESNIAAVRDLVTKRFNEAFASEPGEAVLPRLSEPKDDSDVS
ncbi:hypothetical protein RSAG8_05646, partial [Rhizoctonia solani AG-8 WAC10335]